MKMILDMETGLGEDMGMLNEWYQHKQAIPRGELPATAVYIGPTDEEILQGIPGEEE